MSTDDSNQGNATTLLSSLEEIDLRRVRIRHKSSQLFLGIEGETKCRNNARVVLAERNEDLDIFEDDQVWIVVHVRSGDADDRVIILNQVSRMAMGPFARSSSPEDQVQFQTQCFAKAADNYQWWSLDPNDDEESVLFTNNKSELQLTVAREEVGARVVQRKIGETQDPWEVLAADDGDENLNRRVKFLFLPIGIENGVDHYLGLEGEDISSWCRENQRLAGGNDDTSSELSVASETQIWCILHIRPGSVWIMNNLSTYFVGPFARSTDDDADLIQFPGECDAKYQDWKVVSASIGGSVDPPIQLFINERSGHSMTFALPTVGNPSQRIKQRLGTPVWEVSTTPSVPERSVNDGG